MCVCVLPAIHITTYCVSLLGYTVAAYHRTILSQTAAVAAATAAATELTFARFLP